MLADKMHPTFTLTTLDQRRKSLGKLQAKPSRLHYGRYQKPRKDLAPVPTSFDYSSKLTKPLPMWKNDTVGCCTCSAVAARQAIISALLSGEVEATDNQVIALYSAVTGIEGGAYNPATGANDNGCACVDVLQYIYQNGFNGEKIGAYGDLTVMNVTDFVACLYFSEGLYIGLQLPEYCLNTTAWTKASKTIAGGHCIFLYGSDGTYEYGDSWAERVQLSWAFIEAQVDEAHFILSEDQLNGEGIAANGIDLTDLQNDVAEADGQLSTPVMTWTTNPTPPAPVVVTPPAPVVPPVVVPPGVTEAQVQADIDTVFATMIKNVGSSMTGRFLTVPVIKALQAQVDVVLQEDLDK